MGILFKAVVLQKKRQDGTRNVKIRITYQRKSVWLATPWYVNAKDVRNGDIKDQRIRDYSNELIHRWRVICDDNWFAISQNDVQTIAQFILRKEQEKLNPWALDFAEYTRQSARRLISQGHEGTGGLRITAINSLCNFLGTTKVPIETINSHMLQDWIDSLGDKRAPSLYKMQLQAVYNQAKREFNNEEMGIIRLPLSPFAHITLPRAKTPKKRALTIEQVKAIAALPSKGGRYDFARDLFLLSFGLVGMNAADLHECTTMKNNHIEYERKKTRSRRADNAFIRVRVQPQIAPLVKRYRDDTRVFKFWRMYATTNTMNRAVNIGLKEVGRDIGVPHLTFYAARHSWATIALNDAGVDKWTVHLALNHVDPTTAITDVYIRRDWRIIDDANAKVLALVFG